MSVFLHLACPRPSDHSGTVEHDLNGANPWAMQNKQMFRFMTDRYASALRQLYFDVTAFAGRRVMPKSGGRVKIEIEHVGSDDFADIA